MTEYLIWLQLSFGIGNVRAVKALEYFGNAKNIYNASDEYRQKSGLFTANELRKLSINNLQKSKDIIKYCENNGIEIIDISNESYPIAFKVLDNSPLVLYIRGKLPDFENLPSICIVGPRKISEYGKKSAYSLAFRLAKSGMIIVSGGAKGGDYYAHLGALKAEGITVLIMACGIDCGYLAENQKLRDCVAQSGCIISEHPPLMKPSRISFLIRNRLMSALALGTVVVEAPKISGTLATANHTLEQGKEVFVIPGSPSVKEYEGSNALLRDGARPLLDVSDIFNEYIPRFPDKIDIKRAYEKPLLNKTVAKKEKVYKKLSTDTISKEAKIVYNQLNKHKFYPDEIVSDQLDGIDILSSLTELEIEGLITSLPGGMYALVEEN